jgi:hypothetical protein
MGARSLGAVSRAGRTSKRAPKTAPWSWAPIGILSFYYADSLEGATFEEQPRISRTWRSCMRQRLGISKKLLSRMSLLQAGLKMIMLRRALK